MAYNNVNALALNAFSEKRIITKGGACIRYFIFDILYRINHSCEPNLEHYFDDDDVTYCAANRPIKAGEQIFINYLEQMEF